MRFGDDIAGGVIVGMEETIRESTPGIFSPIVNEASALASDLEGLIDLNNVINAGRPPINAGIGGLPAEPEVPFDILSAEQEVFIKQSALSAQLQAAGAFQPGEFNFGSVVSPEFRPSGGPASGAKTENNFSFQVAVQPPLGMSTTEAERIGDVIVNNARARMSEAIKAGKKATR